MISSLDDVFDTRSALLAKPDRSIGGILIDAGRLSPENAERVLAFQRERGLRFGEAAIALGLLTQEDLRFALAMQFDYTYLAPGERPVARDVVAAYQPENQSVEAVRSLRSQLALRWLDNRAERKALAIVSAEDGAGRSFVTANLGVVFSQLGERTLVVDANLRQPRLHEMFKLDNRVGLSSFLGDRSDLPPVTHLTSFVGLSVLTAGPTPPNPQELLSRSNFRRLFEGAIGHYDVILVDTPSWQQGADAQIIASRAGAALLVTRPDHTEVGPAADFVETLGQSGVQVLGAIVNQY